MPVHLPARGVCEQDGAGGDVLGVSGLSEL